ncbi:MAG: TolC family protein [Pseudomonadota bacterium]
MKLFLVTITSLAFWANITIAGELPNLSFNTYLQEVFSSNLTYAAQKYQVSLAKAAVVAAKLRPNPSLELAYGRDITHSVQEQMPNPASVGIVIPLELGGKRSMRTTVARHQLHASEATLESYWNNLRADAALAFVSALSSQEKLQMGKEDRLSLEAIESFDEQEGGHPPTLGHYMATAKLIKQQQDLLVDAQIAKIALSQFLGLDNLEIQVELTGQLENHTRSFDSNVLIAEALSKSWDLQALRHTVDAANSSIKLASASRYPNVDLGLGITHSAVSHNPIAPSPTYNSVGVSLSFPLQFFKHTKVETESARYSYQQAQKQLEAASGKLINVIRQFYTRYQYSLKQLQHFDPKMLQQARQQLEQNRIKLLQKDINLDEFLSSHEELLEFILDYLTAKADNLKNLIELERFAQIWDISL